MKDSLRLVVVFVVSGLFAACATTGKTQEKAAEKPLQALAVLAPTEGNIVQGNVLFTQEANGVKLVAEVNGLTPGSHGFHIHEVGDCSAPDASSAKGHYNPLETEHGKAGEAPHHVGDLPSLEADADGNAKLEVVLSSISLTGEHAILGRGLIVHANPDDYTQPVGNAGARVACAVIQQN